MLSALAPARRRLVLAALTLLVVLVVAGVVAVVVHRRSDQPVTSAEARALAAQPPGPVVLVPGYGGSTTGLTALADVLRAAGKDATVMALPGNGTGDLAAQATTLGVTVDAVLSRTGAESVDIVGYSAGGVVTRLWIRNDGGAAKVRRVVTMGSPQHGTDVAGLAGSLLPGACPTACQQLAPDSALLAQLNSGPEVPSGPTWVSIWTTKDDVVLPPQSAVLVGAVNLSVQSICPDDQVAHGGLPTDHAVQALVAAELGAGPPVAKPVVSCSA